MLFSDEIEMKNDSQEIASEIHTKEGKSHEKHNTKMAVLTFPAVTYNVLDAKFVSSCFN